MFKTIDLKFANMRKPQNFVFYPKSVDSKEIILQSDKSIGKLNIKTKKFFWTNKGSYFMHLSLFAKETELTTEQINNIITIAG
jgi:hypothetical protein